MKYLLLFNLIFCTFLITQIQTQVQNRRICADILTYRLENEEWHGFFEVKPILSDDNTWINVKVFLSGLWEDYDSSLQLKTTTKETGDRYRNNQTIEYQINFDAKLQLPNVTRIELQSTLECVLLCVAPPDQHPKAIVTYMSHIFYPQGRSKAKKRNCGSPSTFLPQLALFLTDNSICGITDPKFAFTNLAFGGTVIPKGSWPWLTAIFVDNLSGPKFVCGGTLISSQVVLSAAHCFVDLLEYHVVEDFILYMGRHNLSDSNEGDFHTAKPNRIYPHPDYRNDGSFDADIAVVVLTEPLRYTDHIRPACLWGISSNIDDIAGTYGRVVGWGLEETMTRSNLPKRIRARIVTQRVCETSHTSISSITTRRNFCAGNLDGTGPCEGDSGGGLMVSQDNRWFLRGIVSVALVDNSTQTCDLQNYVIYSDVGKFGDWIKKIITQN